MTLLQLKYVITVADEGSMNKAAKTLFISQPSLSESIMALEEELGIELFIRNNRGIKPTPEGDEFLTYARQVMDQYTLLDERYITRTKSKKKFGVSMQHYTFAVRAFVELVKTYGYEKYEFSVRETKTSEVIDDVRNFKSEIGILYINDFNRKVLEKLFHEYDLEFHELVTCNVCVYLWKNHPLAQKDSIEMSDLDEYPCMSFEQGNTNSFYFSEEVLSSYEYKRAIKVNDRATMLNLMVGLNGFTMCSGLICENLNGSDYKAIPLNIDEKMIIGYITKKGMPLSNLGSRYVEELTKACR